MASCPHCGRELISEGFSYCPWCATPLLPDTIEQRKTVTVVIVDLVGSTAMGSMLDPEVLHDVMRTYRDSATLAVSRHGGSVSKFIGDALVGTFGARNAHEDDALRAVRAGADVLSCVDELNADLPLRLGFRLAVRVGINTGEVLIDHASPDPGLLVGDVANVAARLEESALPGEIRVGGTTAALVRDAVDLSPLAPLLARGKSTAVTAYVVDRVHPMGGAPRRRRFSGPLVGRTEPLRRARAAFDETVSTRRCVLLTVAGDAGVGKSRLVDELLLVSGTRATILSGRCLPYGEGATYWPLVQVLQRLRAEQIWSDRLTGVTHARAIARGLDALLGSAEMSSGAEMSWAFRRLLETLADERPVAVVIDDVQWAESSLLELIVDLTVRLTTVPVMLICIARTEFLVSHPSWGTSEPIGETIHLEPLSATSTEALVTGLLGGSVDADALARIRDAAQGVPLFVEELVAAMADEEPHVRDLKTLGNEREGLVVPPTIHALLTARLDRLSSAERRVLDVAAVIGLTFYPEAISALVGDGSGVTAELTTLLNHDLIRAANSDLPEFTAFSFNHLLVRDCAYDTVPLARRANLHEALARWLDGTSVGQAQPELVATRLERAATYRVQLGRADTALNEEAAIRLILCAHRARLVDDIGGAHRILDRAEALAPAGSVIAAATLLARSEVDEKAGEWSRSLASAEQAERAAGTVQADALLWRARLQTVSVQTQVDPNLDIGRLAHTVSEARKALTVLRDDVGLARTYELTCEIDNYLGHYADSVAAARLGLAAALRAGDFSIVADLVRHRMLTCYLGPADVQEEIEAVEELEQVLGGRPEYASELEGIRMILRMHLGDLHEAYPYFLERAELAREHSHQYEAVSKYYWVIETQEWLGDLDGACDSIRVTIDILERSGETAVRSTQLAELALLLARRGLDAEARQSLADSRALAQGGDYIDWVLFEIVEGLLAARQGDAEGSDACFERGRSQLATTDSWYGWRCLRLAESLAAEALGDRVGARDAAQALLSLTQSKGWVPAIEMARQRVAQCDRL